MRIGVVKGRKVSLEGDAGEAVVSKGMSLVVGVCFGESVDEYRYQPTTGNSWNVKPRPSRVRPRLLLLPRLLTASYHGLCHWPPALGPRFLSAVYGASR